MTFYRKPSTSYLDTAMSYRERSIYSHRAAASKPLRGQDPSAGDGGTPSRGRKKPTTREKERERDGRRAVTAISLRAPVKPRKSEAIDPKKALKGKKASKSSIQLKREALEQPELQQVYAPQEVVIPASPAPRVNPYQKYQQLIDELNRKYEHEQTLEKIYHRHIEFSVDMGAEARRRRPRQGGALSRTEAVGTSTLCDGEGDGDDERTTSGRQSVVELRYEAADEREGMEDARQYQQTKDSAATAPSDLADLTDLAVAENDDDGTGSCDSSDPDDTLATFEEGRRGADAETDAFDPYRIVAIDDQDDDDDDALGATMATMDDDDDTRRTSQTSLDMDGSAPASSDSSLKDADVEGPRALGVESGESSLAGSEGEDFASDDDGDDHDGEGAELGDGDGYALEESAGSDLEEDADETRRDMDGDDGSDSEEGGDESGRYLEDAVGSDLEDAVGSESGDGDGADGGEAEDSDVEGGGDSVVGALEEMECDGTASVGQDSASASASASASGWASVGKLCDAKSTTSLPSSVLVSAGQPIVSTDVAARSGLSGPSKRKPAALHALGSLGGGRSTGFDVGDFGGSYEHAQKQIAALQAQVSVLRADKVEEANRRVRAATWMRHVAYVESRLRAELLEVAELWRRLQAVEETARHWDPPEDPTARHLDAVYPATRRWEAVDA